MPKFSRVLPGIFPFLVILGCLSEEPAHIELGKDFNGYENRVMDTTSSFKLNDPFMIQLYNGKEFGSDSVQMIVYAGNLSHIGKAILDRKVKVKSNSRDLVIRGTQNDPLTARGFLRTSKVGEYVLEFKLNSHIIAQKQLSLHSSKE